MFKSDVINFYGTKAKVAKAAGVDPSAVSQWQELLYDPKVYDEYRKTKRAGRLNNENHS
ncbi:transcriptional regulator [Escherichia coli]|nr:transcriptional regulator [Escherichia coli]